MQKKKLNVLYIIIGLLACLLIVQTAAIIYHFSSAPTRGEDKSARTKLLRPKAVSPVGTRHMPRKRPALSPTVGRKTAPTLGDPFANWEDTFMSMKRMQERMDRMFGGIYSDTPAAAFTPSVDLEETETSYILKADLPGLDKDKIDVTVRGNTLIIEGERSAETRTENETQNVYEYERSYGHFSRAITLPGFVDESAVDASYKNGVLTVNLPKLEEKGGADKISVQ